MIVAGRKSPTHSLFDESIATFEDDARAYNQKDAEGLHQTSTPCACAWARAAGPGSGQAADAQASWLSAAGSASPGVGSAVIRDGRNCDYAERPVIGISSCLLGRRCAL